MTPVRIGDTLSLIGHDWRVILALPCGVRELFDDKRSRFMRLTVKEIRAMQADAERPADRQSNDRRLCAATAP